MARMKKLWLIFAWVSLSVGVLLVNAVALDYFLSHGHLPLNIIGLNTAQHGTVAASAPTGDVKGVSTTVDEADARIPLVANFLRRYNAPMNPDSFAKTLVIIADKYHIDFRLLPAIAMQESNLCKVIPTGTYNCLGFGIDEHQTLGFESFEANFDTAGRDLKKYYIDEGLTTPEQIMHKYTPKSPGTWADSVNQWMAEMRYDDHAKGLDLKTNANVLEFTSTATISAVQP